MSLTGTIITCLNQQDFWINRVWIKETALYISVSLCYCQKKTKKKASSSSKFKDRVHVHNSKLVKSAAINHRVFTALPVYSWLMTGFSKYPMSSFSSSLTTLSTDVSMYIIPETLQTISDKMYQLITIPTSHSIQSNNPALFCKLHKSWCYVV